MDPMTPPAVAKCQGCGGRLVWVGPGGWGSPDYTHPGGQGCPGPSARRRTRGTGRTSSNRP